MCWMLLWKKSHLVKLSQTTLHCQSVHMSGFWKRQINNSRSSQSHQVTGSHPHLLSEGLICLCVCGGVCEFVQQRLDYRLVWNRRESSNKDRPWLPLSTYWLSLGCSQSVSQTECEPTCAAKVSVFVKGGHQHVCLMSLTLPWTLSGEHLRGSAGSRAFKDDRCFRPVSQTAFCTAYTVLDCVLHKCIHIHSWCLDCTKIYDSMQLQLQSNFLKNSWDKFRIWQTSKLSKVM